MTAIDAYRNPSGFKPRAFAADISMENSRQMRNPGATPTMRSHYALAVTAEF
jgi:hypothetical protein